LLRSRRDEPTLTLRLRRCGLELAFLTTMTAFSAPGNVTLDELRIETLDEVIERACTAIAGAR
jgi:hypothetical protein